MVAGQPEVREYRVQGMVNNQRVGRDDSVNRKPPAPTPVSGEGQAHNGVMFTRKVLAYFAGAAFVAGPLGALVYNSQHPGYVAAWGMVAINISVCFLVCLVVFPIYYWIIPIWPRNIWLPYAVLAPFALVFVLILQFQPSALRASFSTGVMIGFLFSYLVARLTVGPPRPTEVPTPHEPQDPG